MSNQMHWSNATLVYLSLPVLTPLWALAFIAGFTVTSTKDVYRLGKGHGDV